MGGVKIVFFGKNFRKIKRMRFECNDKILRFFNSHFLFFQFRVQTFFVGDQLFERGGAIGVIQKIKSFQNINDMLFVSLIIFRINAVQIVFDAIRHKFTEHERKKCTLSPQLVAMTVWGTSWKL